MEFLNDWINELLIDFGFFGPLAACIFLILEAIIPILPLVVFVSVNFLVFGNLFGLLISLCFTVLGCSVVFLVFKSKFKSIFDKKLRNKKYLKKLMDGFDKVKFSTLVILLANPFLPSFIFNIGAGLSKISFRKYFIALLVGKIFLIYFWGFIGTSLIESLVEPWILIRTLLILGIAYIISYLVNKKFKID